EYADCPKPWLRAARRLPDPDFVQDVLHAGTRVRQVLDGMFHPSYRHGAVQLNLGPVDLDRDVTGVDMAGSRELIADILSHPLIGALITLRSRGVLAYGFRASVGPYPIKIIGVLPLEFGRNFGGVVSIPVIATRETRSALVSRYTRSEIPRLAAVGERAPPEELFARDLPTLAQGRRAGGDRACCETARILRSHSCS